MNIVTVSYSKMSFELTKINDVTAASPEPPPVGNKIIRYIANLKWKALVTTVILIFDFFVVYCAISLMVFFPSEAKGKECSGLATGSIIGVAPLSVAILSPVFGYLLPVFKIPFSLLIGLLLIGASYTALGATVYLPSGWPFILVCITLRTIEGIGTALFTTAGYSLITQLYPHSAGFVIGVSETAIGVGYASGPAIGGVLYKIGGYKFPFFLFGGLSILLSIPIFLLLIKDSYKSTKQVLNLKIILNLLMDFNIFLLVVGVLLLISGYGFLNATYFVFLEDQFAFSSDKIGLFFLLISAAYAICAPIVGKLADKLKPRILVIGGMLITSLGYLIIGPTTLIPIKPTSWLSAVGCLLIGVGTGEIVATFTDVYHIALSKFAKLGESEPEKEKIVSVIAGLFTSAISLGQFIGPIIGGGLTDVIGFRAYSSVVAETLLALTSLLLAVTITDCCLQERKGK